MKKEPRVDAYISKAQPFAQPVLKHLRELVHKTCPDVEEKIKWGFPHFDYKGGPMCHMASFKQHCAFGFWKAELMKGAEQLIDNAKSEVAMGHMGRITSLEDLPSDKKLTAYIKEAMRLNDAGIKVQKKLVEGDKKELATPDYLSAALKKNKKAKETFDAFSYSNKKEYITWLEDAKTETTRTKRLADAVEWMSEGKSRNWKYQK